LGCARKPPVANFLGYDEFVKEQQRAGVVAPDDPNCDARCGKLRLELKWAVYVGKEAYCTGTKRRKTPARIRGVASSSKPRSRRRRRSPEYNAVSRSGGGFHDGQ